MSFTAITPIDITPGSEDAWVSRDLSPYLPAGATGVLCQLINKSTGSARKINIRHGDSTDNYVSGDLAIGTQQWGICGCNSSLEIDIYIEDVADCEVWLLAYSGNKVTYFADAHVITPTTKESYADDVDISTDTGADTALAGIIMYDGLGTVPRWSRKKGNTETLEDSTQGTTWQVCGVDGSEVMQTYVHSQIAVLLNGYVTDGIIWHDTSIDRSLGAAGSYANLTALGAGATIGLYHVVTNTGTKYNFALHPAGAALDNYYGVDNISFAAPACNASQLVQGKVENTAVKFRELGYFISGSLTTNTDSKRMGLAVRGEGQLGMAGIA